MNNSTATPQQPYIALSGSFIVGLPKYTSTLGIRTTYKLLKRVTKILKVCYIQGDCIYTVESISKGIFSDENSVLEFENFSEAIKEYNK